MQDEGKTIPGRTLKAIPGGMGSEELISDQGIQLAVPLWNKNSNNVPPAGKSFASCQGG